MESLLHFNGNTTPNLGHHYYWANNSDSKKFRVVNPQKWRDYLAIWLHGA
jgi:hypothetical protein